MPYLNAIYHKDRVRRLSEDDRKPIKPVIGENYWFSFTTKESIPCKCVDLITDDNNETIRVVMEVERILNKGKKSESISKSTVHLYPDEFNTTSQLAREYAML